MTRKEKQLLLTDLSARLPYGVKICVGDYICALLDINTEIGNKSNGETFHTVGFNKPDGNYDFCAMTEVKPYLRPMSSMTEEEDTRRCAFLDDIEGMVEDAIYNYIDWLNKNGFDYRGLIPMGLALEAKEGMYETE